ncbi:MAG: YkgJ family cysteine cluster protein [Acidimicrobiales bacterium]
MQRALQGDSESDVPCGSCTACCTSSQFVHISPDELDTLAHVPAELLFPAPRMPRGHVLLGYDHNGRCPMLIDGGCSIYEHRPRTCRTYDCRIFPAAEMEPDGGQAAIAQQARRWRFDFPSEADRVRNEAVRAAARFVAERGEELPEEAVPTNATQRAVLAVRIHRAFLGRDDDTGHPALVDPEPEAIRVVLGPRLDLRGRAG